MCLGGIGPSGTFSGVSGTLVAGEGVLGAGGGSLAARLTRFPPLISSSGTANVVWNHSQ